MENKNISMPAGHPGQMHGGGLAPSKKKRAEISLLGAYRKMQFEMYSLPCRGSDGKAGRRAFDGKVFCRYRRVVRI
jgi:hypothetical protein